MTTLREIFKKTKQAASKSKNNILDFKLEKIPLYKYILHFFLAGFIGGVGILFPYMFIVADGRVPLYIIPLPGIVLVIASMRTLIKSAKINGGGSYVAFAIGFFIGLFLLISGSLDV